MRKLRAKLTYSNVMVTLLAFIVLGGGAYAAVKLPKNSVGAKQLKANSVTGGKVKDHSLTGTDINGPLAVAGSAYHSGSADTATHADTASSAGNADRLDGKDSSEFAFGGSEAWHDDVLNDGNGGQFCHWFEPAGNHTPPTYLRDGFGFVHLRGLVEPADGTDLACGDHGGDTFVTVLPAGYRPANFEHHQVAVNNGYNTGMVIIYPSGEVAFQSLISDWNQAKAGLYLDGITFRCAPAGQNGCP